MSQHDEERASERAAAIVKGWNDGSSLIKRLRARARNTMIPHSIFDAAAQRIEELQALLDDPRLRQALGYLEDGGADEVWQPLRAWIADRDHILSQVGE